MIVRATVPMRDCLRALLCNTGALPYDTSMAAIRSTAATRALPWRKLAVLALVVAVPALALPATLPASLATREALIDSAIASELPSENFPGSALYFLEDQSPSAAAAMSSQKPDLELSQGFAANAGGARPWRLAGSDRDHARAQRCLTMALHYEASSESLSGQRAVAQVIMNRVAHPAWPDTVCGVVFEGAHRTTGCQFSFTCDGAMVRREEAAFSGTAARVAREALAGIVYAPVGYATHYHTLEVRPYWASALTSVATVGAHTFYRWPGAQGQASAFTRRYGGGEPSLLFTSPTALDAPGLMLPGAPILPEATALPIAQPAIPAAPANIAPVQPVLPRSGQVREEYARSGQWLKQP